METVYDIQYQNGEFRIEINDVLLEDTEEE